ncbi:MAG: efflux RND transporter periplasmic adaptor subunit, partial [Rhodoglobus sp.]|nr:efflux RND transporter periplasmic adaptor subunit [Rhodoglobus sp.]
MATVNVGSQVSGNIAKLHVDFNDRVTAGQLIAEIDPSTYEARLVQAEGDLLGARVMLDQKRLNVRRSETLLASQLIARSDHDQALTELHQQEAVVTIKEAMVKSARVDLERTKIRSPIDGVVIDRAIDVGQTVQASFAAPTLFVLAQDLRQMQITANVSEADIGGVAPDKPVTFTVDAFPGETFTGQVRQVRNNTTTTNNVVTYPTIVTVDNPDLKLRPGMTANVTIIVARRENVLRAPNAALRFRPPDTGGVTNTSRRTLYRIHGDIDPAGRATGELESVSVTTGLGDAAFTEIVSGVTAGEVVVTGIALTPAK